MNTSYNIIILYKIEKERIDTLFSYLIKLLNQPLFLEAKATPARAIIAAKTAMPAKSAV